MKGTIFQYDKNVHVGVISGFDGEKYNFVEKDWVFAKPPKLGQEVSFKIEDSFAREIYFIKDNRKIEWKPLVSIIVASFMFLGSLGRVEYESVIGVMMMSHFPIILSVISLTKNEGWRIVSIISLVISALAIFMTIGSYPG